MEIKNMTEEISIEYYNKGGKFPYQAFGIINNKDYFYYRARHGTVSLELYDSREELDNPSTFHSDRMATLDKNSFVTDEEAEDDIKTLYKMIQNG